MIAYRQNTGSSKLPPPRPTSGAAGPVRRRALLIPALIVILGTCLSTLAFREVRRADDDRVASVLALRAEWRARDFQDKIAGASIPVEALAIFLGSQKQVDDDEFHSFAIQAGRDNPIVRLSWAPLMTEDARAGFEAELRKRGAGRDKRVDPDAPVAPREEYLIVAQEERFQEQPTLLGIDFLAEPIRRATAEQARDTGKPVATLPVGSISPRQRPPSYSLFWPVYRDGILPRTEAERRAALIGVAAGSYPIPAMFGFALADTPARVEQLSLFMGSVADVAHDVPLVIQRASSADTEIAAVPLGEAQTGAIRFIRSFQQFGRTWTLVFDFPPSLVADLRSSSGGAYLGFGLLLTSALAGYIATEQRRRRQVEEIVGERTQELRQTGDQLKAMIEASPHAIICLDPQRNVVLWNRSAEEVFFYRADEVLGRRFPLVAPEDVEKAEGLARRVAAGEILRSVDGRHRRKDGKILETSISAAAFVNPAGALQGRLLIIEDCTLRKQVQQQLHQAQKMEAVGQLTGGIAHDFNNLLGIILGNVELLAETFAPDSEEAGLAEAAIQAATHGAELTRQLLAFARRQALAPKCVDLAPLLDKTAHLLRRTLGESIRLEVKSDDDLWPVVIDGSQLESAILNLAVNARDAMRNSGQLTIETANTILDQATMEQNPEAILGEYVVIAVSDTGIGMSPEILSQVFEPFFTTKGAAGTGLGLSMVHGFVRQSGGFTKVYSEPGRGTTIRVYLPRADAQETVQSPIATSAPATGTEIILVVEDNKGMRDIAMRQLQNMGYRTISASDGAQALAMLRDGTPVDLLFTDVVMPGEIDGRALAAAARQLRPELKILFTSGFTGPAASALLKDDLGDYLLSKPYSRNQLASRIRSALDSTDLWRM